MPGRRAYLATSPTNRATRTVRQSRSLGPIILVLMREIRPRRRPHGPRFGKSFEVSYFRIINGLVPVVSHARSRAWPYRAGRFGHRLFRLADRPPTAQGGNQHLAESLKYNRQDEHPRAGHESGLYRCAATENMLPMPSDAGQPCLAPHGGVSNPEVSKSPSRGG